MCTEPRCWGFASAGFRRGELGRTFGASDISSVIALAESENRRKQTGADDRTRKRQFADIMRVVLKTPVFVGVSENCGKESLPPSQLRSRVALPSNLNQIKEFRITQAAP